MSYIEVPNLPKKKVSKVIVDYRISQKSEETLNSNGVTCIKTFKCENVYDEISGHTDIQLIHLGKNEFIIEPSLYNKYHASFKNKDIDLIKGKSILDNEYPKDVAYNGCIIGNKFIHNIKYTDEILLEKLEKKGYDLINVKQGYTKCSISIINQNSIITSDRGIERELSKYFNICFIEEKNIKLGKMQGFIGGSTGLISNNIWCINGDINRLNSCNKILDFLSFNKVNILCLNDLDVIDIGSIIPFKY